MKNVLFATSALVAMAGAAYADGHAGISLTGSARLGIIYDEDGINGGDEIAGTSRVRLGATASGTSDSGLTFGASARFDQGDSSDQSDNRGDGAEENGNVSTNGSVFVSGGFGTLSYQDVDDAVENRVSHVDGVGLTGLGDRNEIDRSAVAGSIIRYDYDAGAFGFSLSSNGGLEEVQVGFGYSGDFGGSSISFGIGYDDTVDGGHIAASLGASFGDISVKLAASDNDAATDMALSVGYSAGALGLTAYVSDRESAGDTTDYGLGASYDLGGGLSLVGGVSGGDSSTVADFGLNMAF